MRHNSAYRKFGRSPSHRRALFRNMATSLLREGCFRTTVQKAKDLRGVVERLIASARTDTLHSRRLAYGFLMSKPVVHKLFAEIGPFYSARDGGYTRVVRADFRKGDAAEMAYIELVDRDKLTAAKQDAKGSAKGSKSTAKKSAKSDADSGSKTEAKPAKEKSTKDKATKAASKTKAKKA